MNDENNALKVPPSRVRVRVLIVILVLVSVTSGLGVWWLKRPLPPTPNSAHDYNPDNLARWQVEAKKLPEYSEFGPTIERPSTDAEITRMIELSRNPNAWIRISARARLSKVTDGPRRPDAVNAVAAGLRDKSLTMRASAMHDLGSMKARECEAELRAFLTGPVEEERTLARRALQRMDIPVE